MSPFNSSITVLGFQSILKNFEVVINRIENSGMTGLENLGLVICLRSSNLLQPQ
jgi:hypothetical protein